VAVYGEDNPTPPHRWEIYYPQTSISSRTATFTVTPPGARKQKDLSGILSDADKHFLGKARRKERALLRRDPPELCKPRLNFLCAGDGPENCQSKEMGKYGIYAPGPAQTTIPLHVLFCAKKHSTFSSQGRTINVYQSRGSTSSFYSFVCSSGLPRGHPFSIAQKNTPERPMAPAPKVVSQSQGNPCSLNHFKMFR